MQVVIPVLFLILGLAVNVTALADPVNTNSSPRDFFKRGVEEYNRGNLPDAEEAFQKAIGMDPNYEAALYNLGTILTQQKGREKEAIPYLKRALELHPGDVSTMGNLGEVLALFAETRSEGEQVLLQAQKLAPDDVTILSGLANLYAREEDYEKAEKYARSAVAARPDQPVFKYNLALMLTAHGTNVAEAADLFRQVLAVQPDDADTMCVFAVLLAKQPATIPEARQLFRKAMEIRSTHGGLAARDAGLVDQYALALSADPNSQQEAESLLNQAVHLNPASGSAFEHLGDLIGKDQKRIAEACTSWHKALTLYQEAGQSADVQRLKQDANLKACP